VPKGGFVSSHRGGLHQQESSIADKTDQLWAHNAKQRRGYVAAVGGDSEDEEHTSAIAAAQNRRPLNRPRGQGEQGEENVGDGPQGRGGHRPLLLPLVFC
jgi:hypothetical protein